MTDYKDLERNMKMRLKNGGTAEVCFDDGIPECKERYMNRDIFRYPEELIDKKCGGCVRCEKRDHGKKKGYHCSMRDWNIDIHPEDKACTEYWDREEHEAVELQHQADIENRRQELWSIYAKRDPIKLPIVYDGYGNIPECPVCGDMPYDTEQCHWCGQRFIQDEDIKEYNEPWTEKFTCPKCGTEGTVYRSKYNGHKHFQCDHCGMAFME